MNEDNNRIRNARLQKGLSQIEVAKRAGIAVNSLRLYEANKRKPKIETIIQIASAMGVDPVELMELDLTRQPQTGFHPSDEYRLIREQNQQRMDEAMDKMNDQGQRIAVKIVTDLSEVPALQKEE